MSPLLALLSLLVLGATATYPFPRGTRFPPSTNTKGGPEPNLLDVTQITNGGTNAEAYWSFDNTKLSFQAIRSPLNESHPCDQVYTMNADGSDVQLISTGKGRDTCSFYYPDGNYLLYSSTQGSASWCPAIPDMNYGYMWPIYDDMEIYQLNLQTGDLVQLTDNDAYDAETTISPRGDLMVFTSDRSGDLEIYIMPLNDTTSEPRRMTYTPGYDGGAVFSYSGNMIAWRAGRPQGDDLTVYLDLLSTGLVEPLNMELYVMTDINNPMSVVQLTNNGAVNFSPYFLPDDSGLIFASNIANPAEFQLYTIRLDGTNMTQITVAGSFNSFPMFSFDGKFLAWESNRNATSMEQIDVYTAVWVPPY